MGAAPSERSNTVKKWFYLSLVAMALIALACGGWTVKAVRFRTA
jgi:hypothetical protein